MSATAAFNSTALADVLRVTLQVTPQVTPHNGRFDWSVDPATDLGWGGSRLLVADGPPTPDRTHVSAVGSQLHIATSWLSTMPLFVHRGESITLSHDLSQLVPSAWPLTHDPAKVMDFYKHGNSPDNFSLFREIQVVDVGDTVTIDLATGKFQVGVHPSPAKAQPLAPEQTRDALLASLDALTRGRNVAFAISGGVDSTLLVALYRHLHPTAPMRCYHANTGSGSDTQYARMAAKHLKVDLVEVKVGYSDAELDVHERMTAAACGPITITGNSIGFGRVCTAARADGFEGIVDGTGADVIFAGMYSIDGFAWGLSKGVDRSSENYKALIALATSDDLLTRKQLAELSRRWGEVDFTDHIHHRLKRSMLRKWMHQHHVNAKAHGIDVVKPYMDPELARFVFNPPTAYFQRGMNKSILRDIMADLLPAQVATRVDKQGCRYPIRRLLTDNRARVDAVIRRPTRIARTLPALDKIMARMRLLTKGSLSRMYALCLYEQRCLDAAAGG